jgi:hypothetical protein
MLGVRGEEFVYELEQRRLHDEANRRDLSKRIRWVSKMMAMVLATTSLRSKRAVARV